MVLGISIDDVLSKFSEKFINVLDLHNPGLLQDKFNVEYIDEIIRNDSNLLKQFSHENLKNEKQLNYYLYEDCPFEFFAAPNMCDNKIGLFFNEFLLNMSEGYDDEHEVIIINKNRGKSKSASLFFLSKSVLMVDNIRFVHDYGDEWKYVDVMVTANNETLLKKPKGKVSVKINTSYNTDIESDYSFDKLKEFITNNDIINEINDKLKC